MMFVCIAEDNTTEAPTATTASSDVRPTHKRPGKSRVWEVFNCETGRCMLPDKNDPTKVCGTQRCPGTGTSGEIRHLEREHKAEWQHILKTGARRSAEDIKKAMLAAHTDRSRPALRKEGAEELDRLVAFWIAKKLRTLATPRIPSCINFWPVFLIFARHSSAMTSLQRRLCGASYPS